MGLHGKLVAAVEFRAGGDVFHELFCNTPHGVSTTTPEKVQGCDLHEGEYGKVGSIICWRYTHEGKEKLCKQVIQSIDERERRIEFKVIEGDLLEEYKDILIITHVETKNEIDLVTWILDYETLNDDGEHPISMLSYFIDITKDIEAHHLKK